MATRSRSTTAASRLGSASMESTARRPVRIFSSRAKQLTSELVFGKQVQFKVKETMLRLPVYATWAYLS